VSDCIRILKWMNKQRCIIPAKVKGVYRAKLDNQLVTGVKPHGKFGTKGVQLSTETSVARAASLVCVMIV
jgi:hypothetical protein